MTFEAAQEFEQDPAESLDYAIEFALHCARLREPNTDYALNTRVQPHRPTGFQYVASGAGRSGTDQPRWPTTLGATVTDGSVTWTAEAISTASLARTLSNATWTADSGLTVTGAAVVGTRATCLISGPQLGQRYLVRCDAVCSDGTTRSGAFWITGARPRTVAA
jgi:hypothetical protein